MTFVAPNLVCGEARGGRIPCHGAVTDEQRSHRPNSAQPGGRQVFFAQTLLLAPHRSTAGYARRSRLVRAKNPLPRTSSYLCFRPLITTPAVEPLAETHRYRPELNPVQVLKDVLGNGSEETWRRQGEPEGRKGLLRSEGAAASFSR